MTVELADLNKLEPALRLEAADAILQAAETAALL